MLQNPLDEADTSTMPAQPPWPRSTTILLLLTGLVLAVMTFVTVLLMPSLPWHGARDLELNATYQAYRETGVLLIKPTGSGSWYTQAPTDGPYTAAAWDDDPGSYIIASLLSHVTGSPSPYAGLKGAMAGLAALPLLVLPLGVARLFRRARAGYVLLAMPALLWLVNHGTVLLGTEYGLSNAAAPTRVYAQYGIAASLVFLSLTMLLVLSTVRLSARALVAVTLLTGALGGVGNLSRAMSGVGTAAGVGVLWWMWSRGRLRWLRAVVAAAVAVVIALMLPAGVMRLIDTERADATGLAVSELPDAHALWHSFYLGLSYPEPITGQPSPFDIRWNDEYGWAQARAVDPDVLIASTEFNEIMKDLYFGEVRESPGAAARLYLDKALYTIKHYGAMLVVAGIGITLALHRRGPHRRGVRAVLAMVTPTVVLGFAPAVFVMPLIYYFSELSAAFGLLLSVGLGGFAWVVSSMPSHVRASERQKIARHLARLTPRAVPTSLSAVVPTRNGAATVGATLATLAGELGAGDEIVVVENGSTDTTSGVLAEIEERWSHPCTLRVLHSEPGLGVALRTGVLATLGDRLLLTADDLPFGLGDLSRFRELPADTLLAIGSKAHVESDVHRSTRRTLQSRVFRSMREALLHSSVGDSQGTIWVDAEWCRMFAAFSREPGLMWTTELVLAAEQQGMPVVEVPVELREGHDSAASRFTFGDAVTGLRGILRLALQKDDYLQDDWLEERVARPW
ncbi:glycosyltransferase [Actinotalea fermentans]|uniref:Glycosyltransferase 2-like domain-containing protein n=1 Tax=Actinotalea fermentans TaxID=43671 RepID=A0A511YTS3_9CELL|nr:glycosyltransferase [Actinotalea fermentans]GEN78592.1 hypothetical protein AFE02nite_03260 [Actinotalea fermentans]